jgi:hypothetical protein
VLVVVVNEPLASGVSPIGSIDSAAPASFEIVSARSCAMARQMCIIPL